VKAELLHFGSAHRYDASGLRRVSRPSSETPSSISIRHTFQD
jgi:hypothetical protein